MFCSSEGGSLPVQRCLCALGGALSGRHESAALGGAFSSKTLVVSGARAVTGFAAAEVRQMAARFRFPRSRR